MKKTIGYIALFILSTALVISCAPRSPVDAIYIFKARINQHVPSGEFSGAVNPNPHPEGIQKTFSQGESLFLILSMRDDLKENVIFSQYTFYNKETKIEVDTGSPEDFETWEAGQTNLVAFNKPWPVPDQPGIYELRVYLGKRIVASAVFQVE
jgi:hypothetical protein